jgi:hypothetical protein
LNIEMEKSIKESLQEERKLVVEPIFQMQEMNKLCTQVLGKMAKSMVEIV